MAVDSAAQFTPVCCSDSHPFVSIGTGVTTNHSTPQAAINLLPDQELEQRGGPLLRINYQASLVSAKAPDSQGIFSVNI